MVTQPKKTPCALLTSICKDYLLIKTKLPDFGISYLPLINAILTRPMRILERVQAFLPLLTIEIFLFFLLVM